MIMEEEPVSVADNSEPTALYIEEEEPVSIANLTEAVL